VAKSDEQKVTEEKRLMGLHCSSFFNYVKFFETILKFHQTTILKLKSLPSYFNLSIAAFEGGGEINK
jgi:hypothetical protein